MCDLAGKGNVVEFKAKVGTDQVNALRDRTNI